MKQIILLWVLMLATGFGAVSGAVSIQPATAGTARDGFSGRSVEKTGKERPFSVSDEMNRGNEKKVFPAGLANDAEAKRVKLMFLLMISLGRYPTPVY